MDSLMSAATAINQFRLHRGYHYPRAPHTVDQCQIGVNSFTEEYPAAVCGAYDTYYCIASEGSRTDLGSYIDFLRSNGLYTDLKTPDSAWLLVNQRAVDVLIKADEDYISLSGLRYQVKLKMAQAGLAGVFPDTSAHNAMRKDFDKIVVAGYAGNNRILEEFGLEPERLQYELVEKVVVRMPDEFAGIGVVVMDGPFGCVDPIANSDLHLLGHVDHAVLSREVGDYAEIPSEFAGALNKGLMPVMRTDAYICIKEDLARFIPAIEQAEYIGSLYTMRVVLPDMDDTDERPTTVTQLDDQVIRVFSGKIGHSVEAAKQVVELCNG
jgi:hypothetical protein